MSSALAIEEQKAVAWCKHKVIFYTCHLLVCLVSVLYIIYIELMIGNVCFGECTVMFNAKNCVTKEILILVANVS